MNYTLKVEVRPFKRLAPWEEHVFDFKDYPDISYVGGFVRVCHENRVHVWPAWRVLKVTAEPA